LKKELQINLFSCLNRSYRFPFSIKAIKELSKIQNVDKVKLCVHTEKHLTDQWRNYLTSNPSNLEAMIYSYPDSNYLSKVAKAQETDCKYSCKLDDDVFVGKHVWDFMIDNLGKINNKNPVIAPILTNGIPSVDLFVKDFLNKDDLQEAYKLFLNGRIDTYLWNLDYSEINNKISSMSSWDDAEYWRFVDNSKTKWDVNKVPWFYFLARGVHPARFSAEYNLFIANKIFENKSKFLDKQNYYLDEYKAPYFTNNVFICESNFWRQTVKLFHDGWDEGQISLQLRLDDSAILYVRNGFGIHMAYGMTNQAHLIEHTYINNL
jgi:hypothetical protein